MPSSLNRYRPYRPRQPALIRAARSAGGRIVAAATNDYTVGIEEEMFLVDRDTLDCVERMPAAFHEEAKALLGDRVKREIIESMIELVTSPHGSMTALGQELASMRACLAGVAARHGLALLACGTHPFSDWRRQTITPKARYDEVAKSLAILTTRVHICGLHVHVALPDADQRISVMNRAQKYLPLFLALSTSSPFWRGASTGLKSYRTAANDETPRTGFPGRFANMAEFERYVAKLTAAGFIPDQSFLWWAIRPSLKYPTLELRVADCCTDWRDAIGIAALYRALVAALSHDPTMGATWECHHQLVNDENRWQAIRHGLDGNVLDAETGRTQTVREAVEELVAQLVPEAQSLGSARELAHVAHILQRGTSAERQTSMFDRSVASGQSSEYALHEVAADIASRTLAA